MIDFIISVLMVLACMALVLIIILVPTFFVMLGLTIIIEKLLESIERYRLDKGGN